MAFVLTAVESRILGCLIEKERLTPENYPLTLRALTLACNQATSREPVVSYSEQLVEEHLFELRQKKLASLVMTAGARVQKYRHHLADHFELSAAETALLCVLLLRGPQTAGELRSRTERLHHFDDVAAAETCLQELIEDPSPLVQTVPARPGQKERRYVQLLAGPPDLSAAETEEPARAAEAPRSRVELLQDEVGQLREALDALRTEFQEFRKQFE
ncbi:MAG: YceH family protein [Verrucomicrobiales bacterium]|nr:YceH family protein [Verrucomicrobiales bacterium]MCP5525949.1 YceH family protein [Verrucomicrobiales bacterium]